MANIGAIKLSDATNPTAGAVFSLTTAPPHSISIECGEATAVLHGGQRDIVVRLPATTNPKSVLNIAHSAAQRSLDLASMQHRMHLVLQGATIDHTLWWYEDDRMLLHQIGATPIRLPEIRMTGVIHRNDGSQEIVTPPVHYSTALRFYRLAQATDDLYEAFRNLYLAFEHLLSDHSPWKDGESERNWLLRALTEADDVTALVPMTIGGGALGRARWLKKRIYTTRVRLFHSKVGEVAYLPHDSLNEQRVVGEHARLLFYLIIAMLDRWHEVRGTRGEFTSYAIERMVEPLIRNIQMIASGDTSQLDQDNGGIRHHRFETGIRLKTKVVKTSEAVGDYRIHGVIKEPTAHGLETVQRIDIVNDDSVLLTQTDESLITLDSVARFDRVIRLFPFAQWLPKVLSGYK